MRVRSTGYSCSELTSLFVEKSSSCPSDKWLNSLINLIIKRLLLMQQPLHTLGHLGFVISNRQIPMCKQLHHFPNGHRKESFFLPQSLWKTHLFLFIAPIFPFQMRELCWHNYLMSSYLISSRWSLKFLHQQKDFNYSLVTVYPGTRKPIQLPHFHAILTFDGSWNVFMHLWH